jgi:hypothetical protein
MAGQEQKIEDLKSNFLEACKEVNYIFHGPDSYESKGKHKLIARAVMAVGPTTPN